MSEVEGGDYELAKAVEAGTRQVLIPSVKSMGETLEQVSNSVGTGADRVADTVLGADVTAGQRIQEIRQRLENGTSSTESGNVEPPEVSANTPQPAAPETSVEVRQPSVPEAGVESTGVSTAETAESDPVDVVSGQLLTTTTDLALAGTLPLVLRRAYSSGYRHGALFGPGWSSSFDIRLLIADGAVTFLGDDGQALTYAEPPRLPLPVYPTHGARWPLTWEADGYRVVDHSTGVAWRFPLQGSAGVHALSAIVDRNGNEIRIVRDGTGVPTEVAHSGGYRVGVETVPAGTLEHSSRVTGLRLLGDGPSVADVPVASFDYDDLGRLQLVSYPSDDGIRYEWDDSDRIVAWIDRFGYRFHYAYDDSGRVVATGGEDGAWSSTFEYDVASRVTTVSDSLGHRTEYHYDAYRHISRSVGPTGAVVETEFDRYGSLISRTDPLGRRVVLERDSIGNVLRVDGPDGSVSSAAYNEMRLPTEVVDRNGAVWRYVYDARGNCIARVDPLGAETRYAFGERGQLESVVDAVGRALAVRSNAAGLPTAVEAVHGGTVHTTRDRFGRAVAFTDPLGATSTMAWTIAGEPLWREDPSGAREEWIYGPGGLLAEYRSRAGAVTKYEYGPFGNVSSRIDPSGAQFKFAYDSELRLISVVNPQGAEWRYEYDPVGAICSERDFNGRTLTYRHDAAGQLVERVNGAGEATRFDYDAAGRPVRRRTEQAEYQFAYDAVGRLIRADGPGSSVVLERDAFGRATSEVVNGRAVLSRYDACGRRVSRTTPSGLSTRWSYDEGGLAAALDNGIGALRFVRDAAGREIERHFGLDAAMTFSYNSAGRLAAQEVWAGGVEAAPAGMTVPARRLVSRRAYTYRPDGLPLEIDDTATGRRQYGLDPVGRVQSVRAQTWSETYAYDAMGNVTSAHGSGDDDVQGERAYAEGLLRHAGRTTYEYDEQHRLVRAVRRTISGKLRQWSYTWDAEDRLVQLRTPDADTWHYGYDALGRRISKSRATSAGDIAEAITFAWDGVHLAEQTRVGSDGCGVALTWDYEPNSFRPVAQTRSRVALNASQAEIDAEFEAIVTDLVGAPLELISSDGRVAWRDASTVWGAGRGSVGAPDAAACPLRFPGQYFDAESGLHYNYFRYYDPSVGRYLSPDPLGIAPSPNPHAYVHNALEVSDPLGLDPQVGQAGRSEYQYDSLNPGPLSEMPGNPANNFSSGKYNAKVTESPTTFYRAGEAGKPFGRWFTRTPPESVAKVRIDNAVCAQWIDPVSGEFWSASPLDTSYAIEFPKGTTYYEGPTADQGGVYVGGAPQIYIHEPWNSGKVVGESPLR